MAAKSKRPEPWGAIRKLPSGRYQASYVGPDTVRYPAPKTFDSKDDARGWLAERRVEIQRGMWKSPALRAAEAEAAAKIAAAERFGAYATTWIAQRTNSKGQPLRLKTRTEYERQIEKGLSTFSNDRLTAITPARVRAWHAARMEVGATAAGAEARLLRAIMNTAVLDGILDRNPVPTALTKSATGVKHRPPTLDELGIVLETIGDEFRVAILLAAYGGLRLGEWRALRRRDLSVIDGRIVVNVERAAQYIRGQGWHVGPPKSSDGVRTVTLPAALTQDVERHLAERVGPFPDDLVFPHRGRGEFVSDKAFYGPWNRARDAAGIRDQVREHDLRAFAGTMHAVGGATLRETMAFLGHSTTVAAMAYQATTGRDADLADRMPLPPSNPRSALAQLRRSGSEAVQ
ncbi:tyrosine-type recombinase/integrase [Microbacterium caowuchunii]|nr:tyrosine-type recombinase/integrase [Microbacterium caowuchunii]